MEKPSAHRVLQKNGEPTPEVGYVTDRLGDAARDFIEENLEEPFYLFVSFTSPHGPLQDAERTAHIEEAKRNNYAGLVVSLDDNVGKILKCIEDNALNEITIVLFTNDNGGQTLTGANNSPLKGKKGQLSEGGIRVPWAMRWEGKIKPGPVIDDPVIEAAGESVVPAWKLDGTSLLKRITGGVESLPERPLFWRQYGSKGARAMRLGKWKLHQERDLGSGPALYDLEKDISESNDVAADHSEIVNSMLENSNAWEAELVEPRWGKNSAK